MSIKILDFKKIENEPNIKTITVNLIFVFICWILYYLTMEQATNTKANSHWTVMLGSFIGIFIIGIAGPYILSLPFYLKNSIARRKALKFLLVLGRIIVILFFIGTLAGIINKAYYG